MATDALQLFDARRSRWTLPDGSLTREAQLFIRELWLRAGGALGPSTNDLATAAFEDAGIEELKATLYALENTALQMRAEQQAQQIEALHSDVRDLRSEVHRMAQQINGIEQGVSA